METERLWAIEQLTAERTLELWPKLKPILDIACQSNEVGQTDITAEDIYLLALTEMCVIFSCTVDGEPTCLLVFQFSETNGMKSADLVAMAGQHLMKFKTLYWEHVLAWLRVNGIQFLDVYANERLAELYRKKFGFERSCVMLRKVL